MKDGFLKAAAAAPKIRVADPAWNALEICKALDSCYAQRAKLIVLPELCLTGYTCQDLFLQERLLEESRKMPHLIKFPIVWNILLRDKPQDLVFSGHHMIAENGSVLAEAARFENETIFSELDVHKICHERRRISTFVPENTEHCVRIGFT